MEDLKINGVKTPIIIKADGKELSEYIKDVNELVQSLEKAKSLINDLSDDMASIKFEIVQDNQLIKNEEDTLKTLAEPLVEYLITNYDLMCEIVISPEGAKVLRIERTEPIECEY